MVPFRFRWKWFKDPHSGNSTITKLLVLFGLRRSYALELHYIHRNKFADPIEEFNHGKIAL